MSQNNIFFHAHKTMNEEIKFSEGLVQKNPTIWSIHFQYEKKIVTVLAQTHSAKS